MKEILSTNEIALLQNVSESRIRQIWCYYRITKTVPILAKPVQAFYKKIDRRRKQLPLIVNNLR
ncbi:MAG: hypothetical protein WCC17_13880 [Candidatus Nitrosopolaris sp.]